MRVCCIADLHGQLPPDVPECDLLLIAGDICPDDEIIGQLFVREMLKPWLERQAAGRIVAVAGNHDVAAFRNPALMRALPWIYLENTYAEIEGLLVTGSAWTPGAGWPFTLPDERLADLWAQIPTNTDILLLHGPPFGYFDLTDSGQHLGSASLGARLQQLPRLKLLCCGHVHESYGRGTLASGAQIVNASLCDLDYHLVNPPIVIKL